MGSIVCAAGPRCATSEPQYHAGNNNRSQARRDSAHSHGTPATAGTIIWYTRAERRVKATHTRTHTQAHKHGYGNTGRVQRAHQRGKAWNVERWSSAIAVVGVPLVGDPPPIQAEWKTDRAHPRPPGTGGGRQTRRRGHHHRTADRVRHLPPPPPLPSPAAAADAVRPEPDGGAYERARARTRRRPSHRRARATSNSSPYARTVTVVFLSPFVGNRQHGTSAPRSAIADGVLLCVRACVCVSAKVHLCVCACVQYDFCVCVCVRARACGFVVVRCHARFSFSGRHLRGPRTRFNDNFLIPSTAPTCRPFSAFGFMLRRWHREKCMPSHLVVSCTTVRIDFGRKRECKLAYHLTILLKDP